MVCAAVSLVCSVRKSSRNHNRARIGHSPDALRFAACIVGRRPMLRRLYGAKPARLTPRSRFALRSMPPHRSASLRAALTPPCPGATARVTSPSAGCPALAAGRRTRRASAPHRSRSCWRRLNRCSQPRRFRPTCGHPAPWLQDVRTYSRTRLWHVREYVRSCPAGLARSATARLRHVGPAALTAGPSARRWTAWPGPEPGQAGRKTNA